MLIKALRSFGGVVSMAAGEVKDVAEEIAKDLIRAGHAERDAQEAEIVEKPVEKTTGTAKKPVENKKK